MTQIELLATEGTPGMGDNLTAMIENQRKQVRLAGQAIQEGGKRLNGDFTGDPLIVDRNRQRQRQTSRYDR